MNIDDYQMHCITDSEKQQLTSRMAKGVAKFIYWSNKDNGPRIAFGTLNREIIEKQVADPSQPRRKPNENIFSYFDLLKMEFRCFRTDRFIAFCSDYGINS